MASTSDQFANVTVISTSRLPYNAQVQFKRSLHLHVYVTTNGSSDIYPVRNQLWNALDCWPAHDGNHSLNIQVDSKLVIIHVKYPPTRRTYPPPPFSKTSITTTIRMYDAPPLKIDIGGGDIYII